MTCLVSLDWNVASQSPVTKGQREVSMLPARKPAPFLPLFAIAAALVIASFQATDTAAVDFADLTPQANTTDQELTMSNLDPRPNTPVTFSGHVRNQGTAAAGPSRARFCVDNPTCQSSASGRVGNDISVSSLAPSADTSITSAAWPAVLGRHTIYLCVDVKPPP